jgi:hypothetical protein
MLAGIGLYLRPVQRHPTQLHRSCFQGDLQHLFKQSFQRGQVNLAEIRDGAEIGRVARRQNTERDVFAQSLLDAP